MLGLKWNNVSDRGAWSTGSQKVIKQSTQSWYVINVMVAIEISIECLLSLMYFSVITSRMLYISHVLPDIISYTVLQIDLM